MYKINKEKCAKCGTCLSACTSEAIKTNSDGSFEIDNAKCIECGACKAVCPNDAIVEE